MDHKPIPPAYSCSKCGYTWDRTPGRRSLVCPNCKSSQWNRPKEIEINSDNKIPDYMNVHIADWTDWEINEFIDALFDLHIRRGERIVLTRDQVEKIIRDFQPIARRYSVFEAHQILAQRIRKVADYVSISRRTGTWYATRIIVGGAIIVLLLGLCHALR